MAFLFIIYIGIYLYLGFALMEMAKKRGVENGWLAFIPIANIYIMCMIANKPAWWIVLCLIPFVNIVVAIIIWMAIAQAMGHPSWWGILLIVPFVGLIVPGYLAWATPAQVPPSAPGRNPYPGQQTPPPAK